MNDWHSDFYAAIKELFKDEDLKTIYQKIRSTRVKGYRGKCSITRILNIF
jgi:hypothetical protein